jgi:hypothetical protein
VRKNAETARDWEYSGEATYLYRMALMFKDRFLDPVPLTGEGQRRSGPNCCGLTNISRFLQCFGFIVRISIVERFVIMTLLQLLGLYQLTAGIFSHVKPHKAARLALRKAQKESPARFWVRFSASGAAGWAVLAFGLACW